MVPETRPIIWRTEDSRSSEPIRPRKYFCATMFVAFCDHVVGNSTPRCSNAGFSGSPMTASRNSHSISSNGWTPGVVWRRSTLIPSVCVLVVAIVKISPRLLPSAGFSGVRTSSHGRTESGAGNAPISGVISGKRAGELEVRAAVDRSEPLEADLADPLRRDHSSPLRGLGLDAVDDAGDLRCADIALVRRPRQRTAELLARRTAGAGRSASSPGGASFPRARRS